MEAGESVEICLVEGIGVSVCSGSTAIVTLLETTGFDSAAGLDSTAVNKFPSKTVVFVGIGGLLKDGVSVPGVGYSAKRDWV